MRGLWGALLLSVAIIESSAAAPVVEIPLSFDRANIPMVEVLVDHQRLKLYLDTGARGLHLPRPIAESMTGLRMTGGKNSSVDLVGKVREDEAFVIPELRLAGLDFHEVAGQTLSPWGLGRAEHELPVIGLDVLLSKDLVIDFPHKRLLLSDGKIDFEALYPAVRSLALTRADEGLVVAVKVGEQEWPYVIDTGASISITKASANVNASLLEPCSIPLPEGRCEAVKGHIDSGDLSIPVQLIRMPLPERFKPMGIVGADLFAQCALYIGKGSDTLKLSCGNPTK